MVNLTSTHIYDLLIDFPPYYGDDDEDSGYYAEYPVDTDAVIDAANDYISDKLYDVNVGSEFQICFNKSSIHNHYDGSYVRADAGWVDPNITLWEYLYSTIAINDIYDSIEYHESGYAELIYQALQRTTNIDAAFDAVEDEIRINGRKYEYDEHRAWFEEDFVYRRDLCKRAVAALNDIFKYVDGVNREISDAVDN